MKRIRFERWAKLYGLQHKHATIAAFRRYIALRGWLQQQKTKDEWSLLLEQYLQERR